MKTIRKGFTLIELLVVIGIIGMLASVVLVGLTNARKVGRDARRIADLRTIQNALELYYTKCGYYPGAEDCGDSNGVDFSNMVTSVVGSNLGIAIIPKDPLNSGDYKYFYGQRAGQEYVLGVPLEDTSNKALNDDLDSGFCADPWYCVGVVEGTIPSSTGG